MAKKFNVTITRSAYENVTLEVVAADQDAAEDKINQLVGGTKRFDAYGPMQKGIRFLTSDINGDEESSWEILDCEESML